MNISITPLDKLFSTYIRTKANWRCERCNTQYRPPTKALHNSHFWGRGKKSTRWDEENCCALCYGCHQYLTSHPEEHREFFKKRLGQRRYDALMIRANGIGRKPDLEMIKLSLKQALKELKEENEKSA